MSFPDGGVKHTVYDYGPQQGSTIRMDASDIDYTGKNVLSISTIEHVGNGDYGFPKEPHKAIEILKKMVNDSKNHLISFPVGANRELEEDIIKEGINYFIIERSPVNTWHQVISKDFKQYRYNYPQYAGNAIAVVTNLDVSVIP